MAKMVQYKCPHCGARVEFDSSLQNMKCPYCDSVFTVEEASSAAAQFTECAEVDSSAASEVDLSEDPHAQGTGSTWGSGDGANFALYTCSSCGAELIADETTAATKCPYCDNVVILQGRVSGELKPDLVIPFKVSRAQAVQALSDHLKGKKLLPKVFTAENHVEEIKGVYVPFWLFNTTSDGRAEYTMTNVRTWSDRNYNYTETSHFEAERRGELDFRDVPVDALKGISNDLTESIETFDTSEAVPFREEYLASFYANRYDVTADEAIKRASERIIQSTAEEIDGTVRGYSTVSRVSADARLRNTDVRYALFPVWVLSTTWRDKTYLFAMNGQSGKFVGNLPIDNRRYNLLRGAYAVGFGAAIYALLHFFLGV